MARGRGGALACGLAVGLAACGLAAGAPGGGLVWAALGGAPGEGGPCGAGGGAGGCAAVTLGAVPAPADPAALRAIEEDAVLQAAVGPAGEFLPLRLNETLVDPETLGNGSVLEAGLSGSVDAAALVFGEFDFGLASELNATHPPMLRYSYSAARPERHFNDSQGNWTFLHEKREAFAEHNGLSIEMCSGGGRGFVNASAENTTLSLRLYGYPLPDAEVSIFNITGDLQQNFTTNSGGNASVPWDLLPENTTTYASAHFLEDVYPHKIGNATFFSIAHFATASMYVPGPVPQPPPSPPPSPSSPPPPTPAPTPTPIGNARSSVGTAA